MPDTEEVNPAGIFHYARAGGAAPYITRYDLLIASHIPDNKIAFLEIKTKITTATGLANLLCNCDYYTVSGAPMQITLTASAVKLGFGSGQQTYTMDTTDAYHTYRAVWNPAAMKAVLLVDGVHRLSMSLASSGTPGANLTHNMWYGTSTALDALLDYYRIGYVTLDHVATPTHFA